MAQQDSADNVVAMPTDATETSPQDLRAGMIRRSVSWIRYDGRWWFCSFLFHFCLVLLLAFVGGKAVEQAVDLAPSFDAATVEPPLDVPQQIERFEIGKAPELPTELNTESLSLAPPVQIAQNEKFYDASSTFSDKRGGSASVTNQANFGGLGGFEVKGTAVGPASKGTGGVGGGLGTGIHSGAGGDGLGFGTRGTGNRKALLASGGGTRQTERAVAGALNWLARHQSADGSWSLTAYKTRCKDGTCSGTAKAGGYETAATALALLPFLGAGQTHESKGRYKANIRAGISFLIKNQKPDGDLRLGTTMYAHGLAALALCECYGMSNDKAVGRAAQAALNFIMAAQDPVGGGWRYEPRQPGDTSVTGWQIMALKSGQMAYLNVDQAVFDKAKQFLKSVRNSDYGGRFSYLPGGILLGEEDRAVSTVGLLCQQYLHLPRNSPAMAEGTEMLMKNQPDKSGRNVYYWYYATQVMHNQPGPAWDEWNRTTRRILVNTQCRDGCASGSWDPAVPTADAWGSRGGRLMMTSLSALILEVYYRYLPLYKLDTEVGGNPRPG